MIYKNNPGMCFFSFKNMLNVNMVNEISVQIKGYLINFELTKEYT